jgi:hypothetical protein
MKKFGQKRTSHRNISTTQRGQCNTVILTPCNQLSVVNACLSACDSSIFYRRISAACLTRITVQLCLYHSISPSAVNSPTMLLVDGCTQGVKCQQLYQTQDLSGSQPQSGNENLVTNTVAA